MNARRRRRIVRERANNNDATRRKLRFNMEMYVGRQNVRREENAARMPLPIYVQWRDWEDAFFAEWNEEYKKRMKRL